MDVDVCERPKASEQIGQTSTSCLQKFTIHFRRPAQLKQKKGSPPYKGEFGFDWLRDEYIYPIETIEFDNTTNPGHSVINHRLPLCLDPKELRKEYLKITDKETCDFKPYKQDYYPAWLSIFACDVQGNNADAGSDMHKDGVYLDLQLNEIDKISTDETEIFFEPSDPCLKITPEKISISEFLKTKREEQIIYNKDEQPEINYYYYKLENAVKIICQGDTLKQHEMIKVFAKLGPTKIEVGRLMVYKNDNIGKANIFVVNVITEDFNTNKVIPQSHPSLKSLYNYQSFNQARIKVKIKVIEDFDLFALSKHDDVYNFLQAINNLTYMSSKDRTNFICKTLLDLYEKYGKLSLKVKKINAKDHTNTYAFFTTIDNGYANGAVYYDETKNELANRFVIFKNGLTEDHTYVHEAGHCFSLPHVFSSKSPHIFYEGYTDNYMDYIQHWGNYYRTREIGGINDTFFKARGKIVDNQYKHNMYSFFKWQWDLMFNDQSIEKKK